ncbi:hypothetical protein A6F55_23870 [Prescottella equi]|nr:hypothetical protein A6F55_23870 [Prescottella equi]
MELGGLDVFALAAAIGECPVDVSEWITHPNMMPVDAAASVASALGVPLSGMLCSSLEAIVHTRS